MTMSAAVVMPSSRQSRRFLSTLSLIALIAACVPACLFLATMLASESVDIILHYAVVDFWASNWGTAEQFAGTHPTMANYPPLAHAIAGGVGALAGAPFLGMQLMAISAVAGCYALLFASFLSRDAYATPIAVFICSVAIVCLRRSNGFIGFELVGNYFFAHVVSNAAVLVTLFVLAATRRRPVEIAIVPAIVLIFGWLYPLGQIQLAFGAAALWLMDAAGRPRRQALDSVACGLAILLLSALAVRLHPTYSMMRSISDNNGEILAKVSPTWLAVIAVGLLVASIFLWLRSRNDMSGLLWPNFLPCLGIAAASAFCVHYVYFLLTGAGSEYALRKHTYVVVTVLVVQGSYLLSRLLLADSPSTRHSGAALTAVLASAAGVWAVTWLVLAPNSKDISSMLASLKAVRSFAASHPQLMSNTVARIEGLEHWQNMLVSSVEFRRRDDDLHDPRGGGVPALSHDTQCLVGKPLKLQIAPCLPASP